MMVFTWNRKLVGHPYPVLWYTALPSKGEGEPDSLTRILQSHVLTVAEQNELDALPDGVGRVDYLAQKYPYNDPNPVDRTPLVSIVSEVITIHTRTVEEV